MSKKYKILTCIAILLTAVISYVFGIQSQSLKIFPYYQTKYINMVIHDQISILDKQEIDISELNGKTITILTFGQSNAANFGETKYTSRHNVYNFYYINGKTYKASDPLLGADGKGGSVWTRMGDKLIEQGICNNVVFIPIGSGGSIINRWDVDGDLHDRIAQSINTSRNAGLSIDYIFWHQGEGELDLQTKKDSYKKMFMSMLGTIRDNELYAPIYIALATEPESLGGKEIYQAQSELINGNDIRLGPKVFEEINNLDDRYQYVHFSDSGLNKLAGLWIQAISNS